MYLTAPEAEAYYIMVSRDSFKEVRDHILSMTFNAAVSYVMSYYGATKAVATFIVEESLSWTMPTLTSLELDAIAEAGGVRSDGSFSRGIKIISLTTYSSNMMPVMLNTYERWSSPYMFGQVRYRGTFDTTDKSPLWR